LLPEHRRKGIGTTILAEVIAEADRRGVPLRSTVERTNTATLAFNARLGLLPVAEDEFHVACERPLRASLGHPDPAQHASSSS
jgi:GNAT superfamily N-acetyltransferase